MSEDMRDITIEETIVTEQDGTVDIEESEVGSTETSAAPLIEIRHLGKTFGDHEVL